MCSNMIGIKSQQLQKILEKCITFDGIYSSDSIPHHLTKKVHFTIICNLSPSNQIGSHFITIKAYPSYILYIDSIGLPNYSLESP